MTPQIRRMWTIRALPWVGALIVVELALRRLKKYYPTDIDASGNSDAFHTYLPAARKWLEHGWTFLLNDPFSTRVAPLGYLWPALWHANVTAVRWANGGLFIASALMLAQAARRLGSWPGAFVAIMLYIYHPGIAYYMPKVLTEPLYLFGVILMTWSGIELLLRPNANRNRWYLLVGVGLTITLLTRPVLQLMTVGAICLTAAALWWPHCSAARAELRKLLITLIAACLLPLAFVVKNGLQFDLWSLATGSGAGLYYGVNPLRLGHEPSFMGFTYDIAEVVYAADPATGHDPLNRLADRIERGVALSILRDTRLTDSLAFFGTKLHSWLLYSTPELGIDSHLRQYRSFEWLSIAAAAIVWLIRRRRRTTAVAPRAHHRAKAWAITLLGLGVAAMVIQLLPLLYNTRYNAGFLEPWLILLTAASVGSLLSDWRAGQTWSWRAPRWPQLALVLALAAIVTTLTQRAVRHETMPIDPNRLGPVAPVLEARHIGQATADAFAIDPLHWRLDNGTATLQIPLHAAADEPFPSMDFMDGVWRIRLRVQAEDPRRCRSVGLNLEHPAAPPSWPPPKLTIMADGLWHTYAIFGNANLRPKQAGFLRLSIQCAPGTEISWGGAELLRSTMPQAAKALWQHGIDIDPYSPPSWSSDTE